MAPKTKNSKGTSVALVGLAAIVAATNSAQGFAYVGKDEAEQLRAAGLVEVNTDLKDSEGRFATRATQAGKDKAAAEATPAGAGGFSGAGADTGATNEAGDGDTDSKPKFVIQKNVAIPAISGRGGRAGVSIYPFDAMEVGDSFFVAKAAKNLASTISSANARYAVEEKDTNGNTVMRKDKNGNDVPKTKLTRQYIVRSVNENGVSGSRIWRKA